MIKEELRQEIYGVNPEAIFFDSPSYDNSIIGLTINGAVVYDLRKMVTEFINDNKDSVDDQDDEQLFFDALDYIEFNTIKSLPYIHSPYAPIILDDDAIRLDIEESEE